MRKCPFAKPLNITLAYDGGMKCLSLVLFAISFLAAQQANPQTTPSQAQSATIDAAAQSLGVKDQAAKMIPKDTRIELVALESISSKTAKVGDSVKFAVKKDIAIDGITVVHEGTQVEGTVTKVVRATDNKRDGLLRIRVSEIRLEGKGVLRLTNSDPRYRQSKSDRLKEDTTNTFGTIAGLALLPLELPMAVAMSTGNHKAPGKDAVLPRCFKSDYWVAAPATIFAPTKGRIADQAASISKDECISGAEKPNIDWSISDYEHLIIE